MSKWFNFLRGDSQDGSRLSLIFDIGSGSVGGALVSLAPLGSGQQSEIHYITRQDLPPIGKRDANSFIAAMGKALEAAAADIHQNGLSRLKSTSHANSSVASAYCVLSSLWYVSELRDLTVNKERPFVVTERHIEGLVDRQEEYVKKSELLEYAEKSNDEFVRLDHKVIDVRLNGYQLSNPYGKTANTISANVYLSLVPQAVIKAADRAISHYFHPELFNFHSFGLASFSILRDILEDTEDVLFLDMSGELTDIFIIKGGTLTEAASFPVGSESITRQMVKDLNTTPEEAVSRVALYATGRQDTAASQKIDSVLKDIQGQWVQSFREVTESFAHTTFMPRTVYFISDPHTAPIFKYFIEDIEIEYNKRCRDICQVTEVEGNFFQGIIGGNNSDPFLSFATLFAERVQEG
jgi:hypothetical protein